MQRKDGPIDSPLRSLLYKQLSLLTQCAIDQLPRVQLDELAAGSELINLLDPRSIFILAASPNRERITGQQVPAIGGLLAVTILDNELEDNECHARCRSCIGACALNLRRGPALRRAMPPQARNAQGSDLMQCMRARRPCPGAPRNCTVVEAAEETEARRGDN